MHFSKENCQKRGQYFRPVTQHSGTCMSEINIYEIYKMPYACIFETSLTQTARFKREKNFQT